MLRRRGPGRKDFKEKEIVRMKSSDEDEDCAQNISSFD